MSNFSIQKVAVIGAGVMGGQIAAHITNVGLPVLLLGVVPRDGDDRNCIVKNSIERWLKAEPSPFMSSKNAELIIPGNVEDDLNDIKDADWIIEAITEDIELKREIYRKIDGVRKPGSIVSSSTVFLNIAQLVEGQSEKFARDMMVTRFGNPIRTTRAVEIVMGPKTRQDAVDFISDFCDRRLGKEVIICRDIPDAVVGKESSLYEGHFEGVLLLENVKRFKSPIAGNDAASLWDMSDGVLCVELHSKMNSISMETFQIINQAISIIKSDNKKSGGEWVGLVICGDGEHFSVGADLQYIISLAKSGEWFELEEFLKTGAETYRALRFAPFPTVASVHGMTLGGGCELALHASAIQAHAETSMGLVEVGVGLIPGWGGCVQMFLRAIRAQQQKTSNVPPANQVFETIALSRKSKSASEAVDLQYMGVADGITMNRDRLLYEAKRKVIDLAKGYEVPRTAYINLSGPAGRKILDYELDSLRVIGGLSSHDMIVCKSLETVLCGEEGFSPTTISEDMMTSASRRELIKLLKMPQTLARIEHMLETGERLRN